MKTIEMVKNELMEMSYSNSWNIDEIENVIIETFGDYEFNGVSEIITTIINHQIEAYANSEDAPILVINLEVNEKLDTEVVGITDVNIA